jgi:hypothetical protein
MCRIGLRQRAAERLQNQQPRDFYFAFGFALLAALLHTWALVAELTRAADANTLNSSIVPLLFLLIEFGLLLNVAGLWLHKAVGILISLAGLSICGAAHVIWYVQSQQILEILLSKSFYHSYPEAIAPHPLGLLGATWVNLVVLVMTCVLFIWELKSFRVTVRPAITH